MRKNTIRRGLAALLAAASFCLPLSACSSQTAADTKTTTDVATNFAFDFVSGEYSFTGVEKGRAYCIRLYGLDAEGNEEEFYTFTSSNIPANDDGSQSYAGTVDLSEDCTPGAPYHAYVMTTTSDYKRGLSEGLDGTYVGTYAAPGAITSAVQSGDTVAVTMEQDVFEPYRSLEYPPESFTLTLYSDDQAVQTVTIQLDELTVEDEEYMEGFGPMAVSGTYHHRSGSAEFTGVDEGTYTVTIQANAQDGIYFASAESTSVDVTA